VTAVRFGLRLAARAIPTITEAGGATRIAKRRANTTLLGGRQQDSSATAGSREVVPFACECRRVDCDETVWITERQFWRAVHGDRVALVAVRHADPDERIVRVTTGYLLVQPA